MYLKMENVIKKIFKKATMIKNMFRLVFYQYISTGLVDLLRQSKDRSKTEMLQPFPPAHCVTYNVTTDGNVCFESSKEFHSFTETPLHWQYQGIELLQGTVV